PPELTLLGPQPGLVCGPVEVTARASDLLSNIDRVMLTVDDGDEIQLDDLGDNLFAITVDLDQEGLHDLALIATDGWGNECEPVAVEIDLDLGGPELSVDAPDPGSCEAHPVTITFSAVDAHLASLTATINDQPLISGHTIYPDGSYDLFIQAEDQCEHTVSHRSAFVIDQSDPEIHVLGVTDGSRHTAAVDVTWSVEDPNLSEVTATLDGAPVAAAFT
ncbi:MAG: hypothetical protein GY838_09230, partial [bacterium]|nr:hypothetical protein [bacterium]